VTDVAERFGVSRQALYGWLERYRKEGPAGLTDRSRRPHSSPTKTADWIEQRVIEERRRWKFGSKKILRRLQDAEPEVEWPPRSTMDAIFVRAGLVQQQKKTRRPFAPAPTVHKFEEKASGEVMTVDYKGQFRTLNGRYCYPFTMADPVSKFLLACDAYEAISMEQTWRSMVRVFREHGLPNVVHSDNGIPFGTSGHGRYSTISVRLMKHGIQPSYNRPGHPEDNGGHERMHKELMCCAVNPGADQETQQRDFDVLRQEFNYERPHESLGQDRPASRHTASPRKFPEHPPTLEYPAHFETQLVDGRGRMKWRGQRLFFSDAFINERIAFERTDYTMWRVHYSSFVIGIYDETTHRFS
jgi:transposase InsO family protein